VGSKRWNQSTSFRNKVYSDAKADTFWQLESQAFAQGVAPEQERNALLNSAAAALEEAGYSLDTVAP
jgi:hypothetical protein